MKKVLILCTGNSCRSIMAEALINAKLNNCVQAQSSGVKASLEVNSNAKILLKQKGIWRDKYHSKEIQKVLNEKFDLVVTVCDNAKQSCPIFEKAIKTLHVGFSDPSTKEFSEYELTYKQIESKLLPIIKKELCK